MDTEILRDFVISLKPTVISAKAKLKAKLCHHIQECFILSKKLNQNDFVLLYLNQCIGNKSHIKFF